MVVVASYSFYCDHAHRLGFFVRKDEDDLITNIFSSDAFMQYDYACFGDVVSLDTTSRTNNTYRPLAAFLGFTHHRRSCIFAAALLFLSNC
ncbi:hypothetical protein LIER_39107 [Lithospermum erythrorhizon]|uniref:Uncharacterized protein n=1 Tax=Lithospermum erythrorhizon TaxID=34254 RepID=A0AAV3Q9N9_LITER